MLFLLKRTTFLILIGLILIQGKEEQLHNKQQNFDQDFSCYLMNNYDQLFQFNTSPDGIYELRHQNGTNLFSFKLMNGTLHSKKVLTITNLEYSNIFFKSDFFLYQTHSEYQNGFLIRELTTKIDEFHQIYVFIVTFSANQFQEFITKHQQITNYIYKGNQIQHFIFATNEKNKLDIQNYFKMRQLHQCQVSICKSNENLENFISKLDIGQITPFHYKTQYSLLDVLQNFELINNIFYASFIMDQLNFHTEEFEFCQKIEEGQIMINEQSLNWMKYSCSDSQNYLFQFCIQKSYSKEKTQFYVFSIETVNDFQVSKIQDKLDQLINNLDCQKKQRIERLFKMNGILLQQNYQSSESEQTYSKLENIDDQNTQQNNQEQQIIIQPYQNFKVDDESLESEQQEQYRDFELSHNFDQKPVYKTLNGIFQPYDPSEIFESDQIVKTNENIENDAQKEQISEQQQSLLQKDDESQLNSDFIIYDDPISWVNQDQQDVEVFQIEQDQNQISQNQQQNQQQPIETKSQNIQSNISQIQESPQQINQMSQMDGMVIEQQAKVEEILLDGPQPQEQQFNPIQQQQQTIPQNDVNNQQQQQIVQENIHQSQPQQISQQNEQQNISQQPQQTQNENDSQKFQPHKINHENDSAQYDLSYDEQYSTNDYEYSYDYHPHRYLHHHRQTPKIKHFHHHQHKLYDSSNDEYDESELYSSHQKQNKFNLRVRQKNQNINNDDDDNAVPIIADRIIIEYNFVGQVKEEKIKMHGDDEQEEEVKPKQQSQAKVKSKNKDDEEEQEEGNKSQGEENNKDKAKDKNKNKENNKPKQNKEKEQEEEEQEQEEQKDKDKNKNKNKEKEKEKEKNKDKDKNKNKDKEEEEEKEQEQEQEPEPEPEPEPEAQQEEDKAEEKAEEKGEEKAEEKEEEKGEENQEDKEQEDKAKDEEKEEEWDEEKLEDEWRGVSSKDKKKKKTKTKKKKNNEGDEDEEEELYDAEGRYIQNHPYYQHKRQKKSHYPYNNPGRYPGDELFDEDLYQQYRCMNRQVRNQNAHIPFNGNPYRHRQQNRNQYSHPYQRLNPYQRSNPYQQYNPYQKANPYLDQIPQQTSCNPWMVRQNNPYNYGRQSPFSKTYDPEYYRREQMTRQHQAAREQVQPYRDQVGYFNCYGYDDSRPYYYEAYQGSIPYDPRYQVYNRNIDDPNVFSPFDETVHYGQNYVSEKHFNLRSQSSQKNHKMIQQQTKISQKKQQQKQEVSTCFQVFDQCYYQGQRLNLCGEFPDIPQNIGEFRIYSYIIPSNLEIRFSQSEQDSNFIENLSGSEECLEIPFELVPQTQ